MNTQSKSKCTVRSEWFSRFDSDNLPINRWLKCIPGSFNTVFCTPCSANINCQKKGFQAVEQHMKTKKHEKAIQIKLHRSQLRLDGIESRLSPSITQSSSSSSVTQSSSSTSNTQSCSSSSVTSSSSSFTQSSSSSSSSVTQSFDLPSSKTLSLIDNRSHSTKAEIIWTMKNIASNYSAKSCDGLKEVFEEMFPNNSISKEFSLGYTKLAYMITDCVGPHFRDIFLKDIRGSFFTLCFDETTNSASKKELHTAVRYYSEQSRKIQLHHLETFFIENGQAVTITRYLLKSIENANLLMDFMVTIGRDGPNTNKKMFRLVSEAFKKITGYQLVDIGSCNIHTVHNGFQNGLEAFGDDVANLSIALFYFFDGEALRSQEFKEVQIKLKIQTHRFIKHVPTRWLTLQDSASRIIEQWDAIIYYFLTYLPKKRVEGMKSNAYKNIVKYLKVGTMKVRSLSVPIKYESRNWLSADTKPDLHYDLKSQKAKKRKIKSFMSTATTETYKQIKLKPVPMPEENISLNPSSSDRTPTEIHESFEVKKEEIEIDETELHATSMDSLWQGQSIKQEITSTSLPKHIKVTEIVLRDYGQGLMQIHKLWMKNSKTVNVRRLWTVDEVVDCVEL